MNTKEYWTLHGSKVMLRVCILAGTSEGYMRHLIHGRRNASPKLARRLVEASAKITPDAPMTFSALIPPT